MKAEQNVDFLIKFLQVSFGTLTVQRSNYPLSLEHMALGAQGNSCFLTALSHPTECRKANDVTPFTIKITSSFFIKMHKCKQSSTLHAHKSHTNHIEKNAKQELSEPFVISIKICLLQAKLSNKIASFLIKLIIRLN